MRNRSQSHIRSLIFGALTVLVLAVPAFAQKPAVIDPEAREVLKQSAAAYAALRSYSCQIETEAKIGTVPGSRSARTLLAFQKPDQAAAIVTKNGETQQCLTDGRFVYTYSPNTKTYRQEQNRVPSNEPKMAMASVISMRGGFLGAVILTPAYLASLISFPKVASLTLGPEERMQGVAVRTITKAMEGGKAVYHLTIGVKNHLLYRYRYTITDPKDTAMGVSSPTEIDSSETYTDIQVNPALPPALFLPPAGVKKITDTETK